MSNSADAPFGTFALKGWRERLLRYAHGRPTSWWGRRAALLTRRMVLRNHEGPIDAEIAGVRMRFHVGDNVSERKFLFMPQFCDPAERRYLAEHLTRDGVFLDIGANAGIYSLSAAVRYEALAGAGRVIAVEANPGMAERLKANIALNAFRNRIRVAPLALADKVGEVEFTIADGNLGESGLDTDHGRKIKVPSQTMLGLLEGEGVTALDGIKIDVEGVEDIILGPFFKTAPRSLFPKFIIIENSSKWWKMDLFGLFREVGYTQYAEHRMNVIFSLGEAR